MCTGKCFFVLSTLIFSLFTLLFLDDIIIIYIYIYFLLLLILLSAHVRKNQQLLLLCCRITCFILGVCSSYALSMQLMFYTLPNV